MIWLTPMISLDLLDFQSQDLTRRLHRGGLPPFFIAPNVPERDYQDWMDAYWAKDLLEFFRLERRDSFLQFTELLLARSGSLFEASRYARECGVSHTTIRNYLAALEATYVAHKLRPFSKRSATEIVAAPKVYGFDTGFVFHFRGHGEIRAEDLGTLWEHYVLNELHGRLQTRRLFYWRDKRGHEVDIVLPVPGQAPVAVECKWKGLHLNPGTCWPSGAGTLAGRTLLWRWTWTGHGRNDSGRYSWSSLGLMGWWKGSKTASTRVFPQEWRRTLDAPIAYALGRPRPHPTGGHPRSASHGDSCLGSPDSRTWGRFLLRFGTGSA